MSKGTLSNIGEDERRRVYLRALVALVSIGAAFENFVILKKVLAPGIVALPFSDYLPRLSTSLLPAFTVGWVLAACLFFSRRKFGFVLAACIFYALLLDERSYSNHAYLLGLVVLLIAAGGERLLPFQVTVVYVFSALAKLTAEYLSGDVLSTVISGPRLPAPLYVLAAGTSIVTEIFVAVALWVPSLRKAGFVAAVVLHLAMIVTLTPRTILAKLQLCEFAVVILSCYYYSARSLGSRQHITSFETSSTIGA
jgi:hypothetical protein